MLQITNKSHQIDTVLLAVLIGGLLGLIICLTICPQKDYSSCIDVADEMQYIIADNGVVTDRAIEVLSGRDTKYNQSVEKCLELRK